MRFNQLFIVVILIVCFSKTIEAQVVERYFHLDTFVVNTAVTSLDNHIYANMGVAKDFDSGQEQNYMLRLRQDLSTKDSIHVNPLLSLPVDCELACSKVKPIGDNLIMTLFAEVTEKHISSSTRPNTYTRAHFLLLDSTLTYVDDFTISPDSADQLHLSDFAIDNDTLFIVGYMADSVFRSGRAFILKRTLDGTYTKARAFSDSLFGSQLNIFNNIKFYHDKLLVGIYSISHGSESYAVFDRNLEMVLKEYGSDKIGNDDLYFAGNGFLVTQPGHLPVLMGSGVIYLSLQPDLYFTMATSRLDSNLRMTKIDTFPFSGSNYGDFTSPRPSANGLSYRSADSVLMVMTGQLLTFGRTDSSGASDLYIYNYNAINGTLNWMKIYRTGYTQSALANCEVLENNTYLIGLNEYNWDKYNYPNMSAHLMILNAEGDILGGEESYHFLNDPLSIYPNPFSNDLRIEGLPANQWPFNYEVWDSSGNKLREGNVSENGVIATQGLRPGSFIIQVSGTNGFTQNVPIIKK